LNSGSLNHRITFFEYIQTSDGHGGSAPAKSNIFTTNANVKPLRQDRTVIGNQSELTGGYQIYIRYRRDIQPDKLFYIDYRGNILTISSIQQSDEDREMWLIIAMVSK
jgi:SPP1 family predicted phage head-tail adaptor